MSRAKLLPYAGGKSRLTPRLLTLIPPHECYVEAFAGGAGLLAAKDPAASRVEVLNDLDTALVNLYRVAKYHVEALQVECAMILRSRQDYTDFAAQEGLTDIQRAARFLFLLLNSFANKRTFDSFGYAASGFKGASGAHLMAHVSRLFDRLSRVTIECLDFQDLFRRYDRPATFFYCDPPYPHRDQPYQCGMTWADHERLAASLRGLKGKWLLSISDEPDVRALYEGFTIEAVEVGYSISRDKSTEKHRGRELLIRNY